ncbi:MAG: hypothetical protein OEU26_05220 [Candidatus Tectomicrobia bacterium]|nr:hypothetical protein [Candidatus Tectomicrobia bacterium]
MQIQESEPKGLLERRLWAYQQGSGWLAVDPAECDFDEDRVAEATVRFEGATKEELMRQATASHFEIVMWLE